MLYVVTWITDFAGFLVVFTVSRRLAEEGTDTLTMGLIGALFAIAATLTNVLAGRLADRGAAVRLPLLCDIAPRLVLPVWRRRSQVAGPIMPPSPRREPHLE